jgi:hypothetical protein
MFCDARERREQSVPQYCTVLYVPMMAMANQINGFVFVHTHTHECTDQ